MPVLRRILLAIVAAGTLLRAPIAGAEGSPFKAATTTLRAPWRAQVWLERVGGFWTTEDAAAFDLQCHARGAGGGDYPFDWIPEREYLAASAVLEQGTWTLHCRLVPRLREECLKPGEQPPECRVHVPDGLVFEGPIEADDPVHALAELPKIRVAYGKAADKVPNPMLLFDRGYITLPFVGIGGIEMPAAYDAYERSISGRDQHVGPMFEASLATAFRLIDSSTFGATGPPDGWNGSIVFAPSARIRMLDGSSAPVRRPSFMPQLHFQVDRSFVGRYLPAGAGPAYRSFDDAYYVQTLGFVFTVAHHSNGQEGCLYDPNAPDDTALGKPADQKCQEPADPPGGPTRESTLAAMKNVVSGSFSTNYLQGNLVYRWAHLRRSPSDPAVMNEVSRLTTRLGYRFDGVWSAPGSMDAWLARHYAQHRLVGSAELETTCDDLLDVLPIPWRCGTRGPDPSRPHAVRARVSVDGGTSLGGLHYPWLQAEVATLPSFLVGAGIFARVFVGYDYYNLDFARMQTMFLWGITAPGPERLWSSWTRAECTTERCGEKAE